MALCDPQLASRERMRHDGARSPRTHPFNRLALVVLVALGVAALAEAQPFVTRVSVASDGTQGNDLSALAALSADGRYVAFASYASNLVAGDTNDDVDVFVRDRQAGTTTRVSLSTGWHRGGLRELCRARSAPPAGSSCSIRAPRTSWPATPTGKPTSSCATATRTQMASSTSPAQSRPRASAWGPAASKATRRARSKNRQPSARTAAMSCSSHGRGRSPRATRRTTGCLRPRRRARHDHSPQRGDGWHTGRRRELLSDDQQFRALRGIHVWRNEPRRRGYQHRGPLLRGSVAVVQLPRRVRPRSRHRRRRHLR